MFLKKCEDFQPDIIGLSGVLTSSLDSMKEVIEVFSEAGQRNKVRIITGGNHLTEDALRFINTDGFATDASTGVEICREWMNSAKDGE